MEPSVASLTLHPAVLIAAGYDCLTSKQIRFLNTLRGHYPDKSHHNNEMVTVSVNDCDLGGILNPQTELKEAKQLYAEASSQLENFPYTHKSEIFSVFYYDKMTVIWSDLIHEICVDLDNYSRHHKLPVRYFRPTHQVIHDLSHTQIYQKISALHSCGLGNKLSESFEYVFKSLQASFNPVES